MGRKAALHASFGVRELWVIDANQRRTHIHTGPKKAGAWEHIVERGPDDFLTCDALPGFSAKLGTI